MADASEEKRYQENANNVQDMTPQQQEAPAIGSKKDFLSAVPEPEVRKVWCDGLQKYVYLKQMSANDQDSYESELVEFQEQEDGSTYTQHHLQQMRAKYLARCLCDANGVRFFKDDEYQELGSRLGSVITELHRKALDINKTSQQEQEETRKK